MKNWTYKQNILVYTCTEYLKFCLVTKSCPTLCDPRLQHAMLPCPSLSPWVFSYPCPSSWSCHPTISSFVVPFSFCPLSFPASGSSAVSQIFESGGQSIGVSATASVLPINIQGWFLLRLTGLNSLLSKGLSRVFSSTTIQMYQWKGPLRGPPRLAQLWECMSGIGLC